MFFSIFFFPFKLSNSIILLDANPMRENDANQYNVSNIIFFLTKKYHTKKMGWQSSIKNYDEVRELQIKLSEANKNLLEALESNNKKATLEHDKRVEELEARIAELQKSMSPSDRTKPIINYSVTYVSEWTSGEPPPETIFNRLVSRSELRNEAVGIVSKITLIGKYIMQSICGDEKEVMSLIKDIQQSTIHHNIRIVRQVSICSPADISLKTPFEVVWVSDCQSIETLSNMIQYYIIAEPFVDRVVATQLQQTEISSKPKSITNKRVIMAIGLVGYETYSYLLPQAVNQSLVDSFLTLVVEKCASENGICISSEDGLGVMFSFHLGSLPQVLQVAADIITSAEELRKASFIQNEEKRAYVRELIDDDPDSSTAKEILMSLSPIECMYPACAIHVDTVTHCTVGDENGSYPCFLSKGVTTITAILLLAVSCKISELILLSKIVATDAPQVRFKFTEASCVKIKGIQQTIYNIIGFITIKDEPESRFARLLCNVGMITPLDVEAGAQHRIDSNRLCKEVFDDNNAISKLDLSLMNWTTVPTEDDLRNEWIHISPLSGNVLLTHLQNNNSYVGLDDELFHQRLRELLKSTTVLSSSSVTFDQFSFIKLKISSW